MDDLFIGLLTNLPNLAGFILLAYYQNKNSTKQFEQYDALLDKYHTLVEILAKNNRITEGQMQSLLDHERSERT